MGRIIKARRDRQGRKHRDEKQRKRKDWPGKHREYTLGQEKGQKNQGLRRTNKDGDQQTNDKQQAAHKTHTHTSCKAPSRTHTPLAEHSLSWNRYDHLQQSSCNWKASGECKAVIFPILFTRSSTRSGLSCSPSATTFCGAMYADRLSAKVVLSRFRLTQV